jgi:hypothetical protein
VPKRELVLVKTEKGVVCFVDAQLAKQKTRIIPKRLRRIPKFMISPIYKKELDTIIQYYNDKNVNCIT